MALVAALCCFGLRVLQRRSKGYAKTPLAGTFDDPEDDDAGARTPAPATHGTLLAWHPPPHPAPSRPSTTTTTTTTTTHAS